MSVRKSSHGTIFLIVSSGSPRALIASSLRATSKKLFCPMTRSLHPPMTACGHRVRFVATRREEFFEVPNRFFLIVSVVGHERAGRGGIHFVAGKTLWPSSRVRVGHNLGTRV